ncbi:penicillin-binding protein 1C [Reichenbachiella agariperforans]|nr:penicillin-binding protein 1C [Reichenbachiella agariperforans]
MTISTPIRLVVGSMWNRIILHISQWKRYQKALALCFLVALFLFWVVPLSDPVFEDHYATTLETRDGQLLAAIIADDGQWRFPQRDTVPDRFAQCIRLFEDEYFDYHPGINPVSIFHALLSNIRAGSIRRGGSTLSMQVIRMSRHNPARTFGEKILESFMALKLELLYSKEQILVMYSAHAPFGGNVVGLDAAAWRYYGRSADQLSWGEAAALAVLPNSPALIFPGRNDELLENKRAFLLAKLLDRGIIDSLTYRLSLVEELPGRPKPLPQLAPHLLTRAIKDGKLGQRTVVTLDTRLQRYVYQKTHEHMEALVENHIHNAAVLVVEIATGEAKAYLGNTDAGHLHGEHVDVITAQRSTGSLLKPFLYAAAIDDGQIAPRQLTKDYPLIHKGFSPKNFDKKYRGAVSADEALRRSLNLPFVNLLIDYGYERFHHKLQELGMSSLRFGPDHYGLSIILGGSESSLWELTNMYTNMYRVYDGGKTRPVTRTYDSRDYGLLSYDTEIDQNRYMDVRTSPLSVGGIWSALTAMTDLNRPEDFENWERLNGSSDVAWKTGTSYGFRDAWSIGINGQYVVGVWVGNADGEGRSGLVGVRAAAPLMFDVFEALDGTLDLSAPTHETIAAEICILSGHRAGDYCESTRAESVPLSVGQSEICPYHEQLHLDSTERYQVNSACYSVQNMVQSNWFILPPVQAWYYRRYHSDYRAVPEFMPACQETDDRKHMSFIYPKDQSKIYIPNEIDGKKGQAIFEIAHQDIHQQVYWHMDGDYLGQTTVPHQMGIVAEAGDHTLYVLDEEGQSLALKFEVIN